MLHDNYLCLVEFNKQQIKEVRSETQPENSETKTTRERVWIRPTPMNIPPSLSCDKRIKMKKSDHGLFFRSAMMKGRGFTANSWFRSLWTDSLQRMNAPNWDRS